MTTIILPHEYIINRGYISATQNILTDIISIGNYIGPPITPSTTFNQGCAPNSTINTNNGPYQWGTASANNTPITHYRNITPFGCINNTKKNGLHDSSILDYNYFNLVIDQSGNPQNSNVWTNNLKSSGNPYSNSSTPFINIKQPGNNIRTSYKNPAQSVAMPSSGNTLENSLFYITYNTNTPFSLFDTSNPSTPIKIKEPNSTTKQISPDQWDYNNTGVHPPYWSMINNEWNIYSRNHVDQILIMDSINTIYLSSHVSHNGSRFFNNFVYGITPIYYCAYAAKILPTVEPFKSLLAGKGIDEIQNMYNIFNIGIINPTIPLQPSSSSTTNFSSTTQSPYTKTLSKNSITLQTINNKNPSPINGVACDDVPNGCQLGNTGTPQNPKIECVAPSCTASPMMWTNTSSFIGMTMSSNIDQGLSTTGIPVTIVPAYSGTVPKIIQVPLYTFIKLLWDMCSPTSTQYVIVDNIENNIENNIPDFSFITPKLQIIFRCYFWALNCINQSIRGSKNLQSTAYARLVTAPYTTLNLSINDLFNDAYF
jgi:hypothetical protein